MDANAKASEKWLGDHVLVLAESSSPPAYVKRVSGFLVQMRNVRHTSGKNMVADAFRTPKPIESLNWLKKRHAGDAFVEAEVEKALEFLMKRDFGHDSAKHLDKTVEDVVASAPGAATPAADDPTSASVALQPPADKATRPDARNAEEESGDMLPFLLVPAGVALLAAVAWALWWRTSRSRQNRAA